jgi:serine protease Do
VDKYGLSVADLTPELARQYGYRDDAKGALITDVQQGSVAADLGLRKGLLIVRVDKKAVTSAAQVKELLQKAQPDTGALVQLQLPQQAGGGTAYRILKPETADK